MPPPAFSNAQVEALGDGQPLIFDHVLGVAFAASVRVYLVELAAVGALKRAGTGRGEQHQTSNRARDDFTAFVDPASAPAHLNRLFEDLRLESNRAAWLGLCRYDLQAARYGHEGDGYERHRDAFREPGRPHPDSRRLTAIYYLNPFWESASGGALRCHFEGRPAGLEHLDIEPMNDRLVVFLSHRLEHEVRPSFAERFALTAWYYAR